MYMHLKVTQLWVQSTVQKMTDFSFHFSFMNWSTFLALLFDNYCDWTAGKESLKLFLLL